MKFFTCITATLLFLCLGGCKAEQDSLIQGSSSSFGSDSSASSSGAALTDGVVLEAFSAQVVGNYPVLTNRNIEDLEVDFPVIAAFFDIPRLEKSDQLDDYILQSQKAGFDKEQFDLLYGASLELIQLIRNAFTEDVSGGQVAPEPLLSNFGNITIEQTIVNGRLGKGDSFTYVLDEQLVLPDCDKGADVCNLHVEANVNIEFPTKNPAPGVSEGSTEMYFDDMVINVSVFKVSNIYSSLDLSLSPESTFNLSFFYYWMSDESNKSISSALNTIKPLSIASYFSDDSIAFSEVGSVVDAPFSLNIKGVFSNQVVDVDGHKSELKMTGAVKGTIQALNIFSNYTLNAPEELKATLGRLRELEAENNIEEPGTLEAGTVSGFIENADLEVNFVTELVTSKE